MSEPTAKPEPKPAAEPASSPPSGGETGGAKESAQGGAASESKAEAKAEGKNAEGKAEGHTAAKDAASHGEHKPESGAKKALAKVKEKLQLVVHGLKNIPALIKDLRQNFKARVVDFVKSIVSLPMLIVRGDLATRLLLLGFAASVALLAMTSAQLVQRFAPKRTASKPQAHVMTEEERKAEEQKALQLVSANMLFLDSFTASLVVKGGRDQKIQLEMYLEANEPETSAILRGHLPQVRETVASAIQGQLYDDLLTEEGKEKFKSQLIVALNKTLAHWTKTGKVKAVFFTRFIMQ